MFFGDSLEDIRQVYFDSWKKYINRQPLTPLEEQIAQVVSDHPEYHFMFEKPQALHQQYYPELGETNPFLHMGLHLAIREQCQTDRPKGILEIFTRLVAIHQDPLAVEHLMMEQLAETLWLAQRNHQAPDETMYLSRLRGLVPGMD